MVVAYNQQNYKLVLKTYSIKIKEDMNKEMNNLRSWGN